MYVYSTINDDDQNSYCNMCIKYTIYIISCVDITVLVLFYNF